MNDYAGIAVPGWKKYKMEKINGNWYGILTINNIEQVVDVIKEILTGKKYTFVAINMYGTEHSNGELVSNPGIFTGNTVSQKEPFNVWYGDDRIYAGFNVSDSSGVWGISTTATDQKYDPQFNNPHIVFEHNHTIRITHRAIAGHLIYWIIAVEKEE